MSVVTALFVIAYTGASPIGAMPPLPDDVLTMCPSSPCAEHDRHERLDPPRDTEHVDVDAPAPVDRLVLPQQRLTAGTDPRVVAHQMHTAVSAHRLLARGARPTPAS